MSLTKQQKKVVIDQTVKKLNESSAMVFTEFRGVSVENFKRLRRELKKAGADLKVLKKRLLNIALKNAGVTFDPTTSTNQLAIVFAKSELTSVAATIYKFAKDLLKAKKGEFGVAGAYDAKEKKFVNADEFKTIAILPSREMLLAQIAIMFTMPLKKLMVVLNERSKKLT